MSLHDVPNFQILFQYLQKAEPKRYEQFLRIHGFHLLANQVFLNTLLLLPLLMVMVKMTIRLMMMLMLMMMTMMMMMMMMMMMQIQMNIFHDSSTPYEVKQVAFDLNRSTVCSLVLLVGGRKRG